MIPEQVKTNDILYFSYVKLIDQNTKALTNIHVTFLSPWCFNVQGFSVLTCI